MEIDKTLKAIHFKFNNFEDLPEEMNDMINKDKLEEIILANAIDKAVCDNFLNLIYDENEEDLQNIPREVFENKYHNLLKIIQEEEKDEGEIEIEDAGEKDILGNSLSQSPAKRETSGNNILPDKNKGPSIIHHEEKPSGEKSSDISIDPNDLFHGVNFQESTQNFKKTAGYISIVRPTNSFKFDAQLLNNEYKFNLKNLNQLSSQNKIIQNSISEGAQSNTPHNKDQMIKNKTSEQSPEHIYFNEDNIQIQAKPYPQLPAVSLNLNNRTAGKAYIKYQQNVNINVNNYGNINHLNTFNPSNSVNFTNILAKNSNIQQKLQDVYFQLNKPIDRNTNPGPGTKNRKESNLITYNMEDILKSGIQKTEDYFTDVFKSINHSGKASLKVISERINKLNKNDNRREKGFKKLLGSYWNSGNASQNLKSYKFINVPDSVSKMTNSKNVNHKLIGLHHMLGDFNLNSNEKILENDFDSLEEKLNKFSIKKEERDASKNRVETTEENKMKDEEEEEAGNDMNDRPINI